MKEWEKMYDMGGKIMIREKYYLFVKIIKSFFRNKKCGLRHRLRNQPSLFCNILKKLKNPYKDRDKRTYIHK